MSVFIGYPSFMAYQMMKGKKGNNEGFPPIPGTIARYSALGLTNEEMSKNPVWVDKTGNGHDLQMKNFIWGGMSGVGGYTENYNSNKWYKVESRIDATWTYKSFNARSIKDNRAAQLFYQSSRSDTGFRVLSCTIKVSGLTDGQGIEYVSNGTQQFVIMRIENDGIYHLPSFDFGAKNAYYGFRFLKLQESCNITIEQLPLYPGALVFDGVDDYGLCDNFPILTKEKGYTVVALRQWITRGEIAQGLVSNVKNWLKDGAFLLEYRNIQAEHLNKPISFGAIGSENDLPHILTYQTSKSYNGVSITTGNFEGTDVLHVGKLAPTNVGTCINAAIWELVFLDHDATEEELTKIKDYFVKTYPWLFPDQAWTVVGKTNEDEDRATIANITGNGNNLVLSNFGFAEGSGYGLYKQNFSKIQWTSPSGRVEVTKTNSSFNITEVKSIAIQLYYLSKTNEVAFTVPSIKVRVVGLTDGQSVNYRYFVDGVVNHFLISSDGIYDLPAFEFPAKGDYYGFEFTKIQSSCNITIEQIPEYEGYLVTDGVDDKAVSKQFKFGENFTVILDFKFPVKKISYCGFDLSSKVRIQNLQGSGVYVVLKGNKTLIPSNVVRAVTSEGKVYDENWNEYNIVPGNISSNYTMVNLGFDGSNQFAESATKLAGIYSSTLSKDDCIKAYNYLQTLKAK